MGNDIIRVIRKELPFQVNLDRLLDAKKDDAGLELDGMYEFSWLASDILEKIIRWHKYAQRNRDLGFSKWGEYFPETVQKHLHHKFFFGAQMMAEEKLRGAFPELSANADAIFLAFAIYGYGVALRGDIPMMDRTSEDLEKEKADFEKILKLNPANTRHYIRRAYDISKERDEAAQRGAPLSDISRTGQFLWAVVVATFLGKGLCEAGHGNFAFVQIFHNLAEDADFLCRIFCSFERLVKPKLGLIRKLMQEHPRWEEKK